MLLCFQAGPPARGAPPDEDTYVPYERNAAAAAGGGGGGGSGGRNSSFNPAKEADDIFMNNLRSDGGGSGGNPHPKTDPKTDP